MILEIEFKYAKENESIESKKNIYNCNCDFERTNQWINREEISYSMLWYYIYRERRLNTKKTNIICYYLYGHLASKTSKTRWGKKYYIYIVNDYESIEFE